MLELLPSCPFKALTGVDCPGCGGTRAVLALLDGDVLRAADHNVLVLVALPVLAALGAWWLLARIGRVAPVQLPRSPAFGVALSVLVLSFWGLRVLGPAPFDWLGSNLSA